MLQRSHLGAASTLCTALLPERILIGAGFVLGGDESCVMKNGDGLVQVIVRRLCVRGRGVPVRVHWIEVPYWDG